ncbi:uncharacterized protein [Typha latifolia]|uniref:uncharacterized protein isoform X2 n=1 Tax=Typha latifolia TaxID=4733 RepID=UPI003C2CE248
MRTRPQFEPLFSLGTMKDSLSCPQEFMESFWFHQNILLLVPTPLDSVMLRSKTSTSSSPDLSSEYYSVSDSERNLWKLSSENDNQEAINTDMRPTRFSDQPIPHQQTPNRNILRSCSSLNLSKSCTRREAPRLKSYNSSSDLENFELKGFMDLGFVFDKDSLSKDIVKMIPGLQRVEEEERRGKEKTWEDEKPVQRPYLSEAWVIKRISSPVFSSWTLPKSPSDAEMKKQLRLWATEVAATIHLETSLESIQVEKPSSPNFTY